jgi:phosphate-selective porin OprO/OprP
VSYAGSVGNGAPDGSSVDVDTNDGKEIAGRIVVRPFSPTSVSPLTGLSLALSGSRGRQTVATALPVYRSSGFLAQTFFSYSGATADGNRTRYSPYVSYYHKAFGAFGEFVHSELPVRKDAVSAVIGHDAWQAVAMLVLTGESASESGVRPRANFDFGNGHWGAIQIAVRYHEIAVDRPAINLGLATAGSSRKAAAWTTGLNWFLTPAIKHVFQFERVVFDDGAAGARPAENVFAFRSQLNF